MKNLKVQLQKYQKQSDKKFQQVQSILHDLLSDDSSDLYSDTMQEAIDNLKLAQAIINDHYKDEIAEVK